MIWKAKGAHVKIGCVHGGDAMNERKGPPPTKEVGTQAAPFNPQLLGKAPRSASVPGGGEVRTVRHRRDRWDDMRNG